MVVCTFSPSLMCLYAHNVSHSNLCCRVCLLIPDHGLHHIIIYNSVATGILLVISLGTDAVRQAGVGSAGEEGKEEGV